MTTNGGKNGKGSLYGIGVGPGDPELLTIKAQRTLQAAAVICFTQLDDGKESYALSVVRDLLEAAEPEFLAITIPSDDNTPINPETWSDAANDIAGHLRHGRDVAFITEGDPMLYSEFYHVLDGVKAMVPDLDVEVVPGVSSVMAAAASSGMPLVTHGQRLTILPKVYGIDDLREAITNSDTTVLMEVDRDLLEALANLESLGLTGKATYVRQASTSRENVVEDISKLSAEDLDYFSLLIIRR
ncbi:MAG: precorrin-2 C(20)-methyltransferase [SAR202 cluster bacterium]|nr:precorrin-2 C(20)-methyltransferase [SAR202 cluster bacterium]MQG33508.1 precorrin-2 C(20)-methyltransferase [SAR202 cluster bacterium]HCP23068.1 precorrin-2 C(20)-methyltransferase [Dehalococcoidia bacterium]|tara:strand:- start:1700 stop:2428 length:729 start_codon:yes stop_codon:yes gene_type:complete